MYVIDPHFPLQQNMYVLLNKKILMCYSVYVLLNKTINDMCKCIVWKRVTSDDSLVTLVLACSHDSLGLCTKANP